METVEQNTLTEVSVENVINDQNVVDQTDTVDVVNQVDTVDTVDVVNQVDTVDTVDDVDSVDQVDEKQPNVNDNNTGMYSKLFNSRVVYLYDDKEID